MFRSKRGAGFTLIELMIVVAILALIALIVGPKFGAMIRKSNEAATRGHLGSVRSAISIYYSDQEGLYPNNLDPFFTPGSPFAMASRPQAYTAEHGNLSVINVVNSQNPYDDDGEWSYFGGTGMYRGNFWLVCVHRDLKNSVWSQY